MSSSNLGTDFVAGHKGLVGSALVRRLGREDRQLLLADRNQLDLRNQAAVLEWMQHHRPERVYVAAGTVGGIHANSTRPAEFLFDNLMIHANLIEASRQVGVTKLLYLGSSCIYPREAPQPIPEDALLSGALEPTNEGYALAKISGLKLCHYYRTQYGCDYISAMPTNLYGPGDNFDLESSHVIPALIRKFHDSKSSPNPQVEIWGTGTPRREFLHVDDLADACVFLMNNYSAESHINVGTGQDLPIRELAEIIRDIVNPGAELVFDATKPDGMPRKMLDTTALTALGWSPSISLQAGLTATYQWFCDHLGEARGYEPSGRRT